MRCSVGLLYADATGTQFYSSLQPLTKEQLQRIKALQGGWAGGQEYGKEYAGGALVAWWQMEGQATLAADWRSILRVIDGNNGMEKQQLVAQGVERSRAA